MASENWRENFQDNLKSIYMSCIDKFSGFPLIEDLFVDVIIDCLIEGYRFCGELTIRAMAESLETAENGLIEIDARIRHRSLL